jgi:hypothetical protein
MEIPLANHRDRPLGALVRAKPAAFAIIQVDFELFGFFINDPFRA